LGSHTPLPHEALNWAHCVELKFEGQGYAGAFGRSAATVYPAGMYPRYFALAVFWFPEPGDAPLAVGAVEYV